MVRFLFKIPRLYAATRIFITMFLLLLFQSDCNVHTKLVMRQKTPYNYANLYARIDHGLIYKPHIRWLLLTSNNSSEDMEYLNTKYYNCSTKLFFYFAHVMHSEIRHQSLISSLLGMGKQPSLGCK
jgi:hypothetical protein